MYACRNLKYFEARNLRKIGNYFLSNIHFNLLDLCLMNLEVVGDGFLDKNINLVNFNADNLKFIGNNFLRCNNKIKSLFLNRLIIVGDMLLYSNEVLECFEANNLINTGRMFLKKNENIRSNYNKLFNKEFKEGDDIYGKIRDNRSKRLLLYC